MRPMKNATKRAQDYTIPADFCQIFIDHMDHLYTLSFLLTADHDKADQCFVAGLEDCQQGTPVFREWARSWATRTVIKNAIRIIRPLRNGNKTTSGAYELGQPISEFDTAVAAITKLQPFDRFVYVMSVLEKYSDRECSLLLDCAVDKIVEARIHALQRLASVVSDGEREALDLAALA
jgi:DNA-directed RNA polymerase specialized sigma24 family protein